MELLISHRSALEYWRLFGFTEVKPAHRQRKRMIPTYALTALELQRMDTRGLTLPLEVMVGAPSAVRKLKGVKPHVACKPLPEGGIIDVGEGLFVASPELCFFQLANRLPLAKHLRLGLELCGSYSLPANEAAYKDYEIMEKGFKNRLALTSTEKLGSFLAHSSGILDQRQMKSILRYIGDGSASPMESRLLVLLTLPYRHGGFGLPMPELDAVVEPGKRASKRGTSRLSLGERDYRCDLYWRDLMLAVEYDSDKYHLLSEQKADDSKKKNYLLSKGVQVITVSKLQLRSVVEIERVAQQLAACHGRQLRYKENPMWTERHYQLRRQLGI